MSAMDLNSHIEKILWTDQEISQRVSELASQITQDFSTNSDSSSSSSAPIIVGVATGAFLFLADLVRKIQLPISVDFVRIESYGSGTVSCGKPKITCDLKIDVRDKHVIVVVACYDWGITTPFGCWLFMMDAFSGVEDIVDTGSTLSFLIEYLKSKGSLSVSVCTLLDKPARRKVNFELVGSGKFYCGFECPDYFVVGYGLDFAELYRNLPYVGVLKPELYQ